MLADLNEELARLGLAMENLGDIDRQTLAGAISTGTHGTGAGCATSPPRSRRWSWSSPTAACASSAPPSQPELLRAARVGVGALGAISAVTLRCVPAFTLEPGRHARAPREQVLDSFQRARRRQRPLRALHLPLRRQRPGPGAQPHRGAAAAARPRRRLPQRRRARELGAGGALGDRQGASRGRSRRSRGWPPGSPRAAARSTAATASSPTSAASASPRWSTACRASTGPRRRGG